MLANMDVATPRGIPMIPISPNETSTASRGGMMIRHPQERERLCRLPKTREGKGGHLRFDDRRNHGL